MRPPGRAGSEFFLWEEREERLRQGGREESRGQGAFETSPDLTSPLTRRLRSGRVSGMPGAAPGALGPPPLSDSFYLLIFYSPSSLPSFPPASSSPP